MNDNKQAEESVVETETTQVAPPTTEVPTTEVKTEAEVSDDQGTATQESDVLPESEEEKRRAFQEQRQEIKRLKSEIQNRTKGESAFSQFRQQTPPVSPTAVNIQDFTDPITGETNWQAYNQQVNFALNQVKQSATYEATQAMKEEMDEQNARTKFPEVFSDPDVEQEIADRWLAAKVRGENPSITDIAERVSKRYGKAVSKAEKIGAEKILNEVSEKEQASLSVSGQTSQPAKQAASAEQLAELSRKSRYGDDDAIAARLSQIPWANK